MEEKLKVMFSLKKELHGKDHRVELATDNNQDYYLTIIEGGKLAIYPFSKSELEKVFISLVSFQIDENEKAAFMREGMN